MFWIMATRGAEETLVDLPLDRLAALIAEPGVNVWVNMTPPIGETEQAIVRDIFKFHPLAIEDCFEEREAPKLDDYGSYLYMITHGLSAGATAEEAQVVELDVFLGPGYLVTHHHQPSRSVTAVREQVQRTGLPLRRNSTNVLHAILDRQVDDLDPLIEGIEHRIEEIEDAVFRRPEATQIEAMVLVRRNVLQLRRWMSKQREVLSRLSRGEFELVNKTDARLFRDVHDHMVRFTDTVDNSRELLTNVLEAYMSLSSNRLNEIMRFLAVFTAMMMPLTVITGIYGMNFENMPELKHPYGYFGALGAMAMVALVAGAYFRHRGWLGRPPPLPPPPPVDAPPTPRATVLNPPHR